MNIAMVGAGKASVILIDQFGKLPNISISLVVDIDRAAPGIRKAREKAIPVSEKVEDIAQLTNVKLIVELTGNNSVFEKLKSVAREDQIIIPAWASKLFYDLIETQHQHIQDCSSIFLADIDQVKDQINGALQPINEAQANITDLLEEAQIISMNGKIQATKAGQYGKAFKAVIDRIEGLIDEIEKAINLFDTAQESSQAALAKIGESKNRMLKEIESY